ncbi:MAG: hypothetical protein ACJ78Y_23910, partial [Myxococcales bacterium]
MTLQAPLRPGTTKTGSIRSVDADETAGRRGGRSNWPVTVLLVVCALSVLVPLYVTLTMAF